MDFQRLVQAGLSAAGCTSGVAVVVNSTELVQVVEVGEMTLSTPLIIGSTSKTITGVALCQLAEGGLIDLDDPIVNYLPDVKVLQGTTIRDVAHHRSGLRADGRLSRTRDFCYSNSNYNLLGQLIELVSGEAYEDYVRQYICETCDRTQPTFGRTVFFGIPMRTPQFRMSSTSWIQAPSGGICMNAIGAASFLQGFLTHRFHLSHNDAVPADGSPAVSGILGDKGRYGFGWIEKECAGVKIFLHTGKTPGTTTLFALIPGASLGIVLLVPYGDFLVSTPLLETLAEALIRYAVEQETVTLRAKEGTRKRFQLHIAYVGALVVSAVFAVLCSRFGAWWLGLLLAAAVGGVVRLASGTPVGWIFRFAPDFFTVVTTCMLLLASCLLF